jgi:hypothetical protein
VPEFLAQSYVARREEAVAALRRARQLRSPRLLHAILVPADEIFLTFWRGPDADAVAMAAHNAGLGPDRVIRVEELSGRPGRHGARANTAGRRNGSGK